MQFVNLTPHPITLKNEGQTLEIAVAGAPARVSQSTEGDGVVRIRRMGELVGLPEPKEGVIFIVSSIVMSAACAQGRTDVIAPAGDVRDDKGRIIATTFFVREETPAEKKLIN